MEKITESGLEILKGEKIIIVKGDFNFEEVFYNFIDGLLKKDYVIIDINNHRCTCTLIPKT